MTDNDEASATIPSTSVTTGFFFFSRARRINSRTDFIPSITAGVVPAANVKAIIIFKILGTEKPPLISHATTGTSAMRVTAIIAAISAGTNPCIAEFDPSSLTSPVTISNLRHSSQYSCPSGTGFPHFLQNISSSTSLNNIIKHFCRFVKQIVIDFAIKRMVYRRNKPSHFFISFLFAVSFFYIGNFFIHAALV